MATSGNGHSSERAVASGPVTELRVHGIGGPTPEDLLDDPRPRQIYGDAEAGFFERRWTEPDEHGVPGRVWGYSWRGMNTRSKAKALWVLLAPFALANLAGFMVQGTGWRRRIKSGLVRAAQLSLTLYLVIWLSIALLDQFAYQCGSRKDCWRDRWFAWLFSPRFMRSPSSHILLGAGLVVIALGLVWLAARSPGRYEHYGTESDAINDDQGVQSFGTPLADPAFWGRPDTVRDLLRVHLGASLALLGGLIGYAAAYDGRKGGRVLERLLPGASAAVIGVAFVLLVLWSWYADRQPAGKHWWSWWAGRITLVLGATLLVVNGALALAGPEPVTRRYLPGLRGAFVAVVLSQALVLFALAAVSAPYRTLFATVFIGTPLVALQVAGVDIKFLGFVLFFLLIVAVALVCLSPVVYNFVRGRILKRSPADADKYCLAPFLMSILAYVVFYGLASALTVRFADLLGDPVPMGLLTEPKPGPVPIRFWHTEEWNGMVWSIGLAVVVATAGVIYGWVLPRRRWRAAPSALVPDDYGVSDSTEDPLLTRARKMVCRTGFIVCLYDVVAIAASIAIALVGAAFLTPYVATHRAAAPGRAVSAVVLGAVAVGVIGIIRGSFNQETRRRSLGLIWDLMAFWPRHYHPFAPAVYSERAVPELADGIARATATGRAVVSAHSQGTVLACCALLQSSPEVRRRTVLVTHGSPLTKLYATFFPRYFSRDTFRRLADELAPGDTDGRRWTNFYRWTDPVGSALLDEDPSSDDRIVDLRNHDPVDLSPDGCPPRIKGHGHYFDDPEVLARVADIRRHLAASSSRGID